LRNKNAKSPGRPADQVQGLITTSWIANKGLQFPEIRRSAMATTYSSKIFVEIGPALVVRSLHASLRKRSFFDISTECQHPPTNGGR
jgi:hypothetical protein